ncbi:MAG: PQQ-binding-like beta-propeller repeat protein [Halanaeroarchaeum sp.]
MHRRRYLRAVGLAGLTGLAGCNSVPFTGGGGPERGQYGTERPVAGLATDATTAYVALRPQAGQTRLAGVGLADAERQWVRELAASGDAFRMWRRGDRLLALNGRTLIVTEAGFSTQTWRRSGATEPIVVDTTAYLRTVRAGRTYVEALGLATGEAAWSIELETRGPIPATQAPRAAAGDRLFLTDVDAPIRARSRADGSRLWQTTESFGVPIAASDRAAFAVRPTDGGAELHRVALGDGRTALLDQTGAMELRPTVLGGVLLVIEGHDGRTDLVGRAGDSGVEQWRRRNVTVAPSWLGPDASFIVDADGELVELATDLGVERWTRPLPDLDAIQLAWSDSVVALATPGRLRCFSRDDGSKIWARSVPEAAPDSPTQILGATGEVVVHAVNDTVRIFDAAR